MNWAFRRVAGRGSMYWSDQKGYCFEKVRIDRENIDGEKNRWRRILGMRDGLMQRPAGDGAVQFLTLFQSSANLMLLLLIQF